MLVLVVAPVLTWVAFAAHEPQCADSDAFWDGDLATGPGEVRGVILGSSQMGLDLDVYALAAGTGHPWQRVARHAVEQASIPATFPRMLASTEARPGMDHLVVEMSPLLFDTVGCARPELDGVPMQVHWYRTAREMLGDEAELVPSLAMDWLPHRTIMTSGRRRDLVDHLTRPKEALAVLRDLPRALDGFHPPARWEGEPVPELTLERVQKRRKFLLGGPLESWKPEVSERCLAVLKHTLAGAAAGHAVIILPPMRQMMRDDIDPGYRSALRAAAEKVATEAVTPVRVLDGTDLYADREAEMFTDFDHLSAAGAADFSQRVLEALR